MKTIVLMLGFFCVLSLAHAQTMSPISDGNSLKAACAAAHVERPNMVTTFSEGQCNGFITGITSTEALLLYGEKVHSSDGSILPSFCVQDGVTYSQSRTIVEKYLNDNPAKLHHNAALLVREALMQAFPCGK